MATFELAVDKILLHEGGYVSNVFDAGGPTNRGITLATYSAWLKRTATVDEVKAMPLSVAKEIYRVSYWGVIQGDTINSEAVASALMDMAVLRGVVAATKTMQSCVGVVADGLMGPKTIAAINAAAPGPLLITYFAASQRALAALVVAKPTQVIFLSNWMGRAVDMLQPLTQSSSMSKAL